MLDEKVSIIVPVYNVEVYLERCVKSIINQTYTNIEILLVDDGSTDKSGILCDEFAECDERIAVFHKENGGLSDARNYGIDRAAGEYLIFVDSDDYIHPQMVEALYKAQNITDADVTACDYTRDIDVISKIHIEDYSLLGIRTFDRDEAMNSVSANGIHVMAWNKLYKKKLFENIRYPKGRIHEDEWILHHLLWECEKVAVISEKLYFYTYRDDSIIGQFSIRNIEDGRYAYEDRVQFVAEKKWDAVKQIVAENTCYYCLTNYEKLLEQEQSVEIVALENRLISTIRLLIERLDGVSLQKEYYKFANNPQRFFRIRKIKRKLLVHD